VSFDQPVENAVGARADIAFALGSAAVAGLVILGLRGQPKAPYDPVGAAAIPFWTAVAVLALAVVLVATTVFGRRPRQATTMPSFARDASGAVIGQPRLALATIALAAGYAALLPVVGFLVASVAFGAALGLALGDGSRRQRWVTLGVASSVGVVLDAVCRALLISLP
jgi:fatty acid desaturase